MLEIDEGLVPRLNVPHRREADVSSSRRGGAAGVVLKPIAAAASVAGLEPWRKQADREKLPLAAPATIMPARHVAGYEGRKLVATTLAARRDTLSAGDWDSSLPTWR